MGIVVTLSREFGSGAEEIGREVADALRLRLIDREVIHEAVNAGIPEDVALESEEGRQSLIHRALHALRSRPTGPSSVAYSSDEPIVAYISTDLPEPVDAYYRAILESIIFNLTQTEDILLVGRAGQIIFRNQPHCFHLRIVAPLEKRVSTIMEQMKVSSNEARHKVESIDAARAAYLKRYHGVDIADSSLYDLCLNTGTLPHETAVQLILTAVRAALKM